MVFIKVYAENESHKGLVLEWMINRIREKGDFSLYDLLVEHGDKLTIEDEDMFGWFDVGWNELDLDKLIIARINTNDLELPGPKYRFQKHYT